MSQSAEIIPSRRRQKTHHVICKHSGRDYGVYMDLDHTTAKAVKEAWDTGATEEETDRIAGYIPKPSIPTLVV